MRYHRSMNRYTYRVEWSSEYGEYVGRRLELPWLSQWGPTMQKAIAERRTGLSWPQLNMSPNAKQLNEACLYR
jgi:hypothetical protein